METIIILGVGGLMGWWASTYAKKQGWDRVIAFIVGFFFGLFGVLGYGIASMIQDRKNAKAIKNAQGRESIQEKDIKRDEHGDEKEIN
jgi:uncharacterized membrane protein (Fun14 family)